MDTVANVGAARGAAGVVVPMVAMAPVVTTCRDLEDVGGGITNPSLQMLFRTYDVLTLDNEGQEG